MIQIFIQLLYLVLCTVSVIIIIGTERTATMREAKRKELCLCRAINPGLLLCRASGAFPIRWSHDGTDCRFEVSTAWAVYNCTLATVNVVLFLYTDILTTPVLTVERSHSFALAIYDDAIRSAYIVVITLSTILNAKLQTDALNAVAALQMKGLMHRGALEAIRRANRLGVSIYSAVALGKLLILLYFARHSTDVEFLAMSVMRLYTYIVYLLSIGTCVVFVAIFSCFEGIVRSELNGTVSNRCGRERRSAEGTIENLRILHETICQIVYKMNRALNPTLFVHVVIEIVTVVIDDFLAIKSLINVASYDYSVKLFACTLAMFHTGCLITLLVYGQRLHNQVYALRHHLLGHASQIEGASARLQARIFAAKFDAFQRFAAAGLFDLDLDIAAPILANILTYVLVALQLDMKREA